MTVQSRVNVNTYDFIISGESYVNDNEVIAQDAGRTAVLEQFTVMAQNATTREWEPLTDVTATDGTAMPRGIYLGPDIAAATLVAGDVLNASILVGVSCTVDQQQVVLENSLTLATVVGGTTLNAATIETLLAANTGVYVEGTVDITEFENA